MVLDPIKHVRRIFWTASKALLGKRASLENCPFVNVAILVPRGRAPFDQHQESRPLAPSNYIPFLNGFVNTIDWDHNQSDLSDLTLNNGRVTGSPWIADFRCWTWPEVQQRSNEYACLSRAGARGNGLHHFHRNKQRQNGGRFKFGGMCFISRG